MRFFGIASLFCVVAAASWAQNTSEITGTVVDSSGLAVPGAQVEVTQTTTGLTRATVTGVDGTLGECLPHCLRG